MKRMRVAATTSVVSLATAIDGTLRSGEDVSLEICGALALWRAVMGLSHAARYLRERPAFLGEGEALAVVPAHDRVPGSAGDRVVFTLQTTTIRRDAA